MTANVNNMRGGKKRSRSRGNENGGEIGETAANGIDAGESGPGMRRTQGSRRKAVRGSGRSSPAAGTTAANLDGKTWLRYSISIWDDLAKSREERGYKHPAMFPASLTDRLLEIFVPRSGGLVLDPFMGSGSTICSAYRKGLPAVGFELSPEYIALTRQRLAGIPGEPGPLPQLIQESSERLLSHVAPESAGLCITSPPYWDVLRQRRTADGKEIRHYGENGRAPGPDRQL